MNELSGLATAPPPPAPPVDLSQLPPPPAPPRAPWYRRRWWAVALIAVLAVVAAVVAFDRGGDGSGAIQLPGGRVVVDSVDVSDRYPAGCSPSPGCWTANTGFELVSVALTLDGDVSLGEPTLTAAGGGSYEVAIRTVSMSDGAEESITLTFAVPEGARGLALRLPGAAPYELDG